MADLNKPSVASGARKARLAALKAAIARIERGAGPAGGAESAAALSVAPLGVAALEAHLAGGGLALGRLHFVEGARREWDDGAVTGFALALLARLNAASMPGRPLLWVARQGDLYAPGVAAFGLDPGALLLVRACGETEVFWVLEEALAAPALAAVVGEVEALPPRQGRRLQLAAEKSGVTALLLRRALRARRRAPSGYAAASHWRVAPAGEAGMGMVGAIALPGAPRWRVELLRARGGRPGSWLVEWNHGESRFALAAALGDRSPPAPRRQEEGEPVIGSTRLAG